MREYSGFAYVYDLFMDNVPYDEWAEYLIGLMKKHGIGDGIVCDLGCGTGKITRRLKRRGYDMIGIDLSPDMLQIAREKEPVGDDSVLYLLQDMREFELYGTVRAVVSICDSMNYITTPEDLLTVFRLVNNYLDPDGVFIFDMHTEHYYRDVLGQRTICDNRSEGSFIWDNYYDPETHLNEYDMTIYYREDLALAAPCGYEEEEDGEDPDPEAPDTLEEYDDSSDEYDEYDEEEDAYFLRCRELHTQRAYSVAEVSRLLNEAELELLSVYDAGTELRPEADSERVYFVCGTRKPRV